MENRFGREMYKLCIFNFLATFCNAFLLNYPRKWVWLKSTVAFSFSHHCSLNGKINMFRSFFSRFHNSSEILKLSCTTYSRVMNYLSSVWQVSAGKVPHLLASPGVGETALSHTVQRLGFGVQSDSVVGRSLLLPSAASDRNRHTDSHLLHPKGCWTQELSIIYCAWAVSPSLCLLMF